MMRRKTNTSKKKQLIQIRRLKYENYKYKIENKQKYIIIIINEPFLREHI